MQSLIDLILFGILETVLYIIKTDLISGSRWHSRSLGFAQGNMFGVLVAVALQAVLFLVARWPGWPAPAVALAQKVPSFARLLCW